jgi:ketosteroid isomerase-like protein
MSRENVELVRRIYAAWEQGASARDFIDADVEYVNPPYAVEPGVRRGRASFAAIRDAIDDVAIAPSRFVDAGDDIVVVATITGTSRGAGVPVSREHGYVWTVRDGQAIRFQWFNSGEQAFEAVGLPPPGTGGPPS